jgi:hypothetical protein
MIFYQVTSLFTFHLIINSFFYVESAKTIDELTQELLDLKEDDIETSGKYLITNTLKYSSYFIRIFIL